MRAGALRHNVTIQQLTEADDNQGGYTSTWTTFATAAATVAPVKGEEMLEHKKLESTITHKIFIRYISGVTAKMRIVFGSRTFEIVGAPRNFDERDVYLEIMATELVT